MSSAHASSAPPSSQPPVKTMPIPRPVKTTAYQNKYGVKRWFWFTSRASALRVGDWSGLLKELREAPVASERSPA